MGTPRPSTPGLAALLAAALVAALAPPAAPQPLPACGDRRGGSEFDFVIVGSGPAGSALASRLTESGEWTVLLLEAGGEANPILDVPFLSFLGLMLDTNWRFTTLPQKMACTRFIDGVCHFPMGRALGGSTAINLLLNIRGNRRDFDQWEQMGNPGWGFDGVWPYFLKVENMQEPELRNQFHGTDGRIMTGYARYRSQFSDSLIKAFTETGLQEVDYNGESQTGVGRIQTTTFNGSRWGAVKGYLNDARQRPNLVIRLRSTATRLLLRQQDGQWRAYGVEYVCGGRSQRATARKEVIVSAGSFNSPKLLMLSGIGPREHLEQMGIPVRADLPVGYNLMEHTALTLPIFIFNGSYAPSVPSTLFNPVNAVNYKLRRQGPLTSNTFFETIAFYDLNVTGATPGWPEVEVLNLSGNVVFARLTAAIFGIAGDVFEQYFRALSRQNVYYGATWRLRPKSRGRVFLADTDPMTPPKIDLRAFSDPEDVEVTILGLRELMKLVDTPTFRRMGARLYDAPLPGCERERLFSDEYWRCALYAHSLPIYHQSGTCKMGPADDPTSVVTPDLAVKGVQGLRVVDVSMMPIIVSGHLQMSAYMIGEKAAVIIKNAYR